MENNKTIYWIITILIFICISQCIVNIQYRNTSKQIDDIEQKVFTEIVTANKILSINPINDRQTDILKNII